MTSLYVFGVLLLMTTCVLSQYHPDKSDDESPKSHPYDDFDDDDVDSDKKVDKRPFGSMYGNSYKFGKRPFGSIYGSKHQFGKRPFGGSYGRSFKIGKRPFGSSYNGGSFKIGKRPFGGMYRGSHSYKRPFGSYGGSFKIGKRPFGSYRGSFKVGKRFREEEAGHPLEADDKYFLSGLESADDNGPKDEFDDMDDVVVLDLDKNGNLIADEFSFTPVEGPFSDDDENLGPKPRNKRPLTFGYRYKFGKRHHSSGLFPDSKENRGPIFEDEVPGGLEGPPFPMFEDGPDYPTDTSGPLGEMKKRPFVLGGFHVGKRPFVLGGFKMGKRPFVLGGFRKWGFGKRSRGHPPIDKRPFGGSYGRGFKIGK